jgi:hypothetical protein
MSLKSYRLWYFEAHLPSGEKVYVDGQGNAVDSAAALRTAFAGTEEQAHLEADRRCTAYDASHVPPAHAMSFSPASTLKPLN